MMSATYSYIFLLLFSRSDVSDSLWPHGLQHARLPCPSPTPGVCSMSLQTHVRWVHNAIQPSHPLSPSSPPALNLSRHQGLFQWVGSSHQVAKILELQLQHQSFQWIFKVDLPYGKDLIKGCWTNQWTLFTESLAIKGTLLGHAWSMGLLLSPQNSCLVIKKNIF